MGFAKATKGTIPVDNSTIESVNFYTHTTGDFRLAIYNDSSGPYSRLWESGPNTGAATTWNTVSISSGNPTSLTLNSGSYWLAWQWDSLNNGTSFVSGGSAGDGNYRAQAYGSFPSTWTDGISTAERWSMYSPHGIRMGANDGDWHYLTVTRSGTGGNEMTTYYDGALVGTSTDARNLTNGNNFRLARPNEASNYFTGLIDEVRVDNASRDAGWIGTVYNNQGSPTTFHSAMPEENWNWSWGCAG
jgi:hypothetical protein